MGKAKYVRSGREIKGSKTEEKSKCQLQDFLPLIHILDPCLIHLQIPLLKVSESISLFHPLPPKPILRSSNSAAN